MQYSAIVQKKLDSFNKLSYQDKRNEALRLLYDIKQISDNEIINNLYENISNVQDIPENIYYEVYKDVVVANSEYANSLKEKDFERLSSINNKILQMKKKEQEERNAENIDEFLLESLWEVK